MCNGLYMTDQLLGAPELAAALGVHRSTIHRRIERGELEPAGTVAGRPVFRREDAEALVRGERTLPPQEPAAPELPAVGTLWRFKSSKNPYQVISVENLIQLEALDTKAHTSLSLNEFARRCVFVGRLELQA